MRGHFLRNLAAGVLIGAAASMVIIPQVDGRTRRKIDKTSRRFISRAGDMINDIREHAR